jgi:hypothetical protein
VRHYREDGSWCEVVNLVRSRLPCRGQYRASDLVDPDQRTPGVTSRFLGELTPATGYGRTNSSDHGFWIRLFERLPKRHDNGRLLAVVGRVVPRIARLERNVFARQGGRESACGKS